jgi:parallel beta-helix repeat protein
MTKKQTITSIMLTSAFPAFARLPRGRQLFLWLAVVLYVGGSVSAFPQGSLTPPGAPAPTMKKLDEIEPRTNLQAVPAPAGVDTTNPGYHFIINQPGSYYLSANLAVTKTNGIQIIAEGVTLDLNGFQIARGSGSGGDGIQISAAAHRISVLNGSIKGFALGINSLNPTSGARGSKLRDLDVSGCTSIAIQTGPGAVLESCRVHDNTGTHGFSCNFGSTLTNCTASTNTVTFAIAAGVGATVINCTVSNNTCSFGIYADAGSSVTHCNAVGNAGTDVFSSGIATSTGCTITASTAYANFSFSSTLSSQTGVGFDVGAGNTIQGCTAANNRGDGVRLVGYTLARGNNCLSNGSSGDGAGIHATSSSNRIEANNLLNNDRGIDVDGPGNVIVMNTAKQNTTNYDIAANNVFGAIVDRTAPASGAVNGNTAPSSAGTTDPWANISY